MIGVAVDELEGDCTGGRPEVRRFSPWSAAAALYRKFICFIACGYCFMAIPGET
jgi:hypothetical protein